MTITSVAPHFGWRNTTTRIIMVWAVATVLAILDSTVASSAMIGGVGPILAAGFAAAIIAMRRADVRSGDASRAATGFTRFARLAPTGMLIVFAVGIALQIALKTNLPLTIAAVLLTGFVIGYLPAYLISVRAVRQSL